MAAVVRVCFVFILIVCINSVAGKPIFMNMICDLFCDDDDITSTSTSTTTSSSEEFYDWGDCSDCRPRRRRTTTPRPQMPFNFVISPGQPMNVTMQNQGNNWAMFIMPNPATPSPVANNAAPAAAASAGTSPGAAPAGTAPVAAPGAAAGDAVAAPAELASTIVAAPTTIATPPA